MTVYKDYKGLNELSIPDRVRNFKETTLGMIAKGEDLDNLKEVARLFEDGEMYEAAEGVLLAIKDHERTI